MDRIFPFIISAIRNVQRKNALNIIDPMPRQSDKIFAKNADVFALEAESPGQCGINKCDTDAEEEKPVGQ